MEELKGENRKATGVEKKMAGMTKKEPASPCSDVPTFGDAVTETQLLEPDAQLLLQQPHIVGNLVADAVSAGLTTGDSQIIHLCAAAAG